MENTLKISYLLSVKTNMFESLRNLVLNDRTIFQNLAQPGHSVSKFLSFFISKLTIMLRYFIYKSFKMFITLAIISIFVYQKHSALTSRQIVIDTPLHMRITKTSVRINFLKTVFPFKREKLHCLLLLTCLLILSKQQLYQYLYNLNKE